MEAACQHAAAVLSENPRDIPFAAIYLVDAAADRSNPERGSDSRRGVLASPLSVRFPGTIRSPRGRWLLCLRTKASVEIGDLVSRGVRIRGNPWPEPVAKRDHAPDLLCSGDSGRDSGGGSGSPPSLGRRCTARFFEMVAGHVGVAISDARAYEQERQRAEALAEIDQRENRVLLQRQPRISNSAHTDAGVARRSPGQSGRRDNP